MEDSGALIFSVFSPAAGTLESMELGPEVEMQYSKFYLGKFQICFQVPDEGLELGLAELKLEYFKLLLAGGDLSLDL